MTRIPRSLLRTACLGSFAVLTATAGAAHLVEVDFESSEAGTYTAEMSGDDFGSVEWADLFDRARIVPDESAERGNVLEIAYPEGAVGPGEGGAQFVVRLPPTQELWMSYRVKFGEDFDFRLGGKLPGLSSGGAKYTGGVKPTKGEGWSARFMWREGGRAVVYLYHVDGKGDWGDDLPLGGFAFVPGHWHRIVERIRVNEPDGSNGILEVWIDGDKLLSRADLRFRIGDHGLIDTMYFSTFHGGNTAEWGPENDSFAYFDDFQVWAPDPDE